MAAAKRISGSSVLWVSQDLRPSIPVPRPPEGGSNGGNPRGGSPLGREEGSRGTIRKVPRALFLFQVSFCRTKRNLTAGGNTTNLIGKSRAPGRDPKAGTFRNGGIVPHPPQAVPLLAAAHSAREGPTLGRVRTLVRRGSDVPPACHSLPRPCFAAPGGRWQPPSPARRMTDEGTQRTDLLFFAGMVPTPRPPRRRGVPFPAMGKEPKDRPGNLPNGSPGPLLPAKGAACPPLDPPAYVTLSRCSAQNSRPSSPVQAPGEAYASSGRGGATECMQGIAALPHTAIPPPMRSATTRAAGGNEMMTTAEKHPSPEAARKMWERINRGCRQNGSAPIRGAPNHL